MEHTPEKPEAGPFAIPADQHSSPRRSTRIKKPPPITPRRFNRFFTPRLRISQKAVRTSRAALRDISGAALNSRQNNSHHARAFLTVDVPRSNKKRKLSIASPTSSIQSSPIKPLGFLSSSQEAPADEDEEVFHKEGMPSISEASTDIEDEEDEEAQKYRNHPRAIPFCRLGTSASILSSRLSGRRTKIEAAGSNLWQHETADFVSSINDINVDNGPHTNIMALPFCAVSCKTNPLVAVGDEEGGIRLIESANDNSENFGRTYLTMKPHDNAIMDLEFSDDDAYLASSSGDQSCHIIDMQTQTSLWCLSGHTSSIKRVQFQPSSNNKILATCARDGNINLWDLRCTPTDRPSFHLRNVIVPEMANSMRHISPTNTIRDAHQGRTRRQHGARTNPIPGRNDFSVTSLSFVSETRPHLIVTASENDSVVKLWDMRTTYTNRRGRPVPMSCTREPKSHELHRRFGITSLSMNTNGSRLYALCRDHTVYAYSTAHLILGDSPEMSQTSSSAFRPGKDTRQGLGPLYGFRHPSLRISTFYPKLAVRRSTDATSELVAVGSSDDCAVVFPTNERYLTKSAEKIPASRSPMTMSRPRLTRIDSQTTSLHLSRRQDDDIPIYYHGTSLTRGHDKEVTAVTWTSEGNLLTASDDYTTRCWRENRSKAKELREGAEGEAARWRAGWAAVYHDDFDDDD